jgi:hypothetical protein
VECSINGGNSGCNGGLIEDADGGVDALDAGDAVAAQLRQLVGAAPHPSLPHQRSTNELLRRSTPPCARRSCRACSSRAASTSDAEADAPTLPAISRVHSCLFTHQERVHAVRVTNTNVMPREPMANEMT